MKSDCQSLDLPQLHNSSQPAASDKNKGKRRRLLVIATSLVFWSIFWQYGIRKRWTPLKTLVGEKTQGKPFDWSQIEAKEALEFHPCFSDFECSKLKLPFDYFNGTYPGKYISVALIKRPAKVAIDDPRYGGPVLINPGGPGGSGVMLALLEASSLQTIVDAPADPTSVQGRQEKLRTTAKYFDIIGFDPRGIGFTEPAASCQSDQASWWSWHLREATEGILGSSDAALSRLWSMSHSYGESCKLNLEKGEPDIKQYMTTASVARDMLEIAERHSEYVSNEVSERITKIGNTRDSGRPNPEVTTYTPGKTKLHYWGFSYGTYLGSTFASMYPDNVGRLVLDGVVNSDDYNDSLGGGSLHDTEKTMASFYTYCIRAGPTACPLSAAASSIEDVEYRVQKIIDSLYHKPIAVSSEDGPEVLEWTDLKNLIFRSLYSPALAFPAVSQILLAVENGTGSPILSDLARTLRFAHTYSCALNSTAPLSDPTVPTQAILCSDANSVSDESIDEFETYWHRLEGISPTAGSIWAQLRLKCNSWKIRAVHRFEGQFGGKTGWPILFVANTADPVTPLRSARIMKGRFEGSGLVVQDSPGHGDLPEPGTFCIPPESAFSLNSTDPASPFYEASFSDAVVRGFDKSIGGVGCKTMHAARRMQSWAASTPTWFKEDVARDIFKLI